MPVLGSKNVPSDKVSQLSFSNGLFVYDLFHFQINLRLILVSGKTKEYLFSPSESAGDIAQFVFDNWPSEWEDEAVSSV